MNFINFIKYFDKSEDKKRGQVRYTQLDLLRGYLEFEDSLENRFRIFFVAGDVNSPGAQIATLMDRDGEPLWCDF